ncbi:MAG TPA: family 16 glycoside hydrolase [Sedimentisphaerales bacterium]|nr:family 16 glycoside hydrolase [Sedimentisphaerales bacterium]
MPGLDQKVWLVDETNGKGKFAKWEIIKDDSAPHYSPVIAITRNKNSGQTYNLLMAKGTSFKNVELEVNLKRISGKEDQGGGIIWRAKDNNNYYVARWNPLEENLRLYVVLDGKRKQLASADVKADPGAWHRIQILHEGNELAVEFDSRELISVKDDTLAQAGMVGLWTKADAATAFNDFYPQKGMGD